MKIGPTICIMGTIIEKISLHYTCEGFFYYINIYYKPYAYFYLLMSIKKWIL